mgnify:CR=1 FL=1
MADPVRAYVSVPPRVTGVDLKLGIVKIVAPAHGTYPQIAETLRRALEGATGRDVPVLSDGASSDDTAGGTVVALAFERRLRRTGRLARAGVMITYAACLAVLFLAFPSNPDPVRLPPELVGEFRFLSLLGQFVLWTAMGGMFWWLCRKVSRAAPAL